MIEIRDSNPADIQIARELFLEYADSLDFELSFQDFDREIKNLPGDYSPPTGFILLAYSDAKPVGCIALRQLETSIAEMKRLYVKPLFQGQGIGRRLTEELLEKAVALGYAKIRLDTVPSMKAAIEMYAGMGFYPIPPYRKNPIAGTTYLEKNLKTD